MKLYVYLKLFRTAESTLIAGTAGMALLMSGINSLQTIASVFFTLLLGTAGIMAWNDSLDTIEDSVAHPERPIISGQISVTEARLSGTVLILIALLNGFNTAPLLLAIGLTGVTIGILYSLTSKSHFLIIAPMKNLVVVGTTAFFLATLPVAFGKQPGTLYWFFVLSLLLILFGYEVLKDIRDVEGDLTARYRTLPILKGIRYATAVAIASFTLSCLTMAITFFIFSYQLEGWISLTTTVVVILPFLPLLRNPSPETSDLTRVLSVGILLVSLGVIGGLFYARTL